jgi:hypothetical protein
MNVQCSSVVFVWIIKSILYDHTPKPHEMSITCVYLKFQIFKIVTGDTNIWNQIAASNSRI